MGLIQAVTGAAGGTLADQWLEFFSMDALPSNVLVRKGQKNMDRRSSNTRGSENIISSGSGVIVAAGQAVAIVDNGVVVEFCSDPGSYTFDSSSQPSIFANTGGFGERLLNSFREGLERVKYGGGVHQDQRVYYFNTRELTGNKYGTAEPIPYRVVDVDINLDMDVDLRCNGEFSYRLTNPIQFYSYVAGNVDGDYTREMLDSQLRAELLTGLNAAFAKISAQGIRYSALPGHAPLIAAELNEVLSARWRDLRGIEIVSFAVNSVSIADEDEKRIKDLQAAKSLRDPTMAGAVLTAAQADAMRSAAENEGGAAIGFMGLGMANMSGGTSASDLYAAGARGGNTPAPSAYGAAADGGFGAVSGQPVAGAEAAAPVAPAVAPPAPSVAPYDMPAPTAAPVVAAPVYAAPAGEQTWDCPNCGQTGNSGNFCSNCGTKKPEPATWDCPVCGKTGNEGNFCSNCGTKKP